MKNSPLRPLTINITNHSKNVSKKLRPLIFWLLNGLVTYTDKIRPILKYWDFIDLLFLYHCIIDFITVIVIDKDIDDMKN